MDKDRPTSFTIADDLVLSSLRQAEALYRGRPARGAEAVAAGAADPVVAKLRQAEDLYRQFQARWEAQIADLLALQAREAENQETIDQLGQALKAARRRLEQEHEEAGRQQERAEHLHRLLGDIHRSFFGGNVYDLILRACLTITGATRGLYVTARGADDAPRVRAAIDVDGYPQAPISDFIAAICRTVLAENDTLANSEAAAEALPAPDRPGERFRNFAAVPVVLLANRNGIVIAADKLHGEFIEADTEALLSVGARATPAVDTLARHDHLQRAYVGLIGALTAAMEEKDPYALGQSAPAAAYAGLLAERLALPAAECSAVCYAALLRDVGKIGISDGILHKPGPLLPAERELVRGHARIGHDLLAGIPELREVATIVLHHHERYDGMGYPARLRGEAIPFAARIVGVVDAYCAMRARRSYREAFDEEQARVELTRGAGTQFDPRIVSAFLAVLDDPATPAAGALRAACGVLPGFVNMEEERAIEKQRAAGG